jgi:hypothetical protein
MLRIQDANTGLTRPTRATEASGLSKEAVLVILRRNYEGDEIAG